jgi:hypothetical protein
VYGITGWRHVLMWPLARLVRLWGMTLRFEISPETVRIFSKCDVPVAFVLWHNRLFLATEIHRRYRPQRKLYALISASKDGAWLAEFFAITPDGPRGPCYDFKPGAVIVPRRTGAPVILVGGDFTRAWRLGSWDRFYLPLPFSRVRMSGELIENAELADRDAAAARIKARLLQLNPDASQR